MDKMFKVKIKVDFQEANLWLFFKLHKCIKIMKLIIVLHKINLSNKKFSSTINISNQILIRKFLTIIIFFSTKK